jgi:hypothetical protein
MYVNDNEELGNLEKRLKREKWTLSTNYKKE